MTLQEKVRAVAEEYQRESCWIRTQEVGKMLAEWLADVPDVEPFTFAGYPDNPVFLHPCGTVVDTVPGSDTEADVKAGQCDCENTAPWMRIYVEKTP